MGKILRFLSIFIVLFGINTFDAMAESGYVCPVDSKKYTLCNNNLYMVSKDSSGEWLYNGEPETGNDCQECPDGCTCVGGTIAPSANRGHYFTGNACPTCLPNMICPGGDKQPIVCETGTHPNTGATECETCPDGKYYNGSTCAQCSAGKVCSNDIEKECDTGWHASDDATKCIIDCPAGQMPNTDGTACESCPDGNICPDGRKPIKCSDNTHPSKDATKCIVNCDAGTIPNTEGTACTTCPSGYICTPDDDEPQKCPAGTHPNAAATACMTDCATGYYDNGNACVVCPTGSVSVGGTAKECTQCASGTTPNTSKSQCVACPDGKICITGEEPKDCPTGKKPNETATECVPACTAGQYHDGTNCTACPAGKICPGGVDPEDCTAGTTPNETATACVKCPDGKKCLPGKEPETCPDGTMPNDAATACITCLPGNICKDGIPTKCEDGTHPNTDATMCETCDAGNFCKDGVSTSCPVGYTSYTGATSVNECFINVPAGRYLASAGGDTFTACPMGTAQGAHTVYYGNSDACTQCGSRRYYANTEGLTTCKIASNGDYFGGEQTTGCDANGRGCTNAKLCEAGFWCHNGEETPCPTPEEGWTLSDREGTNMRELCYETQTPAGCASGTLIKYAIGNPWGTISLNSNELTALPNHYVSEMSCPACPVGTTSEGGAITECTINCDPGQYHDGTACRACPIGTTSLGGTSEECEVCPDGSYPDATASQCIACPLGQICKDGIPENCDAGKTPNADATECIECPEGHICLPGVEPTVCPDGTYSDDTHSMCFDCPAGMICKDGIQTSCPVGYTSAVASKEPSECFAECVEYKLDGGTAIPVTDKAFYPAQCEYKGMSDDGVHPCEIVDDKCIVTSCKPEYELIGGKCVACNRDGAEAYKQTGNCQIERCRDGLHPNGDMCVGNSRECTLPNAISAIEDWDFSKKAFMACHPTECVAGYHIEGTVCAPDEQACRVENGVGTQEWDSVRNTWGECVATSCDPGYTNNWDETNEHTKQCGVCKNKYSLAGEVAARYGNEVQAYNDNLPAASSYVRGCEIATCMNQGQKYALEDNFCRPICTSGSDETGSRRWTGSKCEISCNSGFTQW